MTAPDTRAPIVWAIAGTDSGGGAGLAADLRAAEACGVHLCTVVAAVTAQNSVAVTRVEPVAADVLDAQLAALAADLPPAAIKTGLLGSVENIAVVARWVDALRARAPVALVIDPVLGSSTGAAFGGDAVVAAYRDLLLPRATLVTPNRGEALRLVGADAAWDGAAQPDACGSVVEAAAQGGSGVVAANSGDAARTAQLAQENAHDRNAAAAWPAAPPSTFAAAPMTSTSSAATTSATAGAGAGADATTVPALATKLLATGAAAACITGGDDGAAQGGWALDFIATPHARGWLALPRVATPHTHGTGCTFATLAACALARGFVAADALVLAKMGTAWALRRARAAGEGAGPVVAGAAFVAQPDLLPWLGWDDDVASALPVGFAAVDVGDDASAGGAGGADEWADSPARTSSDAAREGAAERDARTAQSGASGVALDAQSVDAPPVTASGAHILSPDATPGTEGGRSDEPMAESWPQVADRVTAECAPQDPHGTPIAAAAGNQAEAANRSQFDSYKSSAGAGDRPVSSRIQDIGLYAIVDSAARVRQVLAAGVGTVQLRIKTQPGEPAPRAAIADALAAAAAAGTTLVVNDHWRAARALAAAEPRWAPHLALHLGQEDAMALTAHERAALAASGVRLGLSTHSLWELCRARTLAPWYVACGPVWPTLTKAMPWRPQGLRNLAWWVRMAGRPVVGIGGILAPAQMQAVAATGVAGACVVRGLGDDPARTVPQWQQAWDAGRAEAAGVLTQATAGTHGGPPAWPEPTLPGP